MKASSEIRAKTVRSDWPHPSLVGEVASNAFEADERNQTGILTSGIKPRSRLPDPNSDQWHWEIVARYSGATVPEFHRVPCHLTALKRR